MPHLQLAAPASLCMQPTHPCTACHRCAALMTLYTIAEVLVISLLVMPMPSNALRGKIQGQSLACHPTSTAARKHDSRALVVVVHMHRCCEQAVALPGVRQENQLGAADPELVSGSFCARRSCDQRLLTQLTQLLTQLTQLCSAVGVQPRGAGKGPWQAQAAFFGQQPATTGLRATLLGAALQSATHN